jgi:hypothetical protein
MKESGFEVHATVSRERGGGMHVFNVISEAHLLRIVPALTALCSHALWRSGDVGSRFTIVRGDCT